MHYMLSADVFGELNCLSCDTLSSKIGSLVENSFRFENQLVLGLDTATIFQIPN